MDIIYYVIVGVIGLGFGIWLGRLMSKAKGGEAGRIARLEENVSQLELQRQELKEEKGVLEAHLRSAEGLAREVKARFEAEREVLTEAKEKFQAAFAELAGNALSKVSRDFLALAEENLEKKRKDVDRTIQPLSSALAEYRKQTIELKTTLDQQQSLIGKLDAETGQLLDALKRPQVRGRWGEVQLRRLVELAGMQAHVDFEEQVTVSGGEGRLRPDMVIHFPNERIVVIDAKTSADHYLRAVESESEEKRLRELGEFARTVKDRMRELGQKGYWKSFDRSPEFVIQFLPGESFFATALEHDHTLIEYGLARRVLLCSPLNLMSLLLAVKLGWQEHELHKSAQEIARQGRSIYESLCTMTERIDNLGKNLAKSMSIYNKLIGSIEGNVLLKARRFKEMGISTDKELPVLEEKHITLRRIRAPELLPGQEPPALPSDENGL